MPTMIQTLNRYRNNHAIQQQINNFVSSSESNNALIFELSLPMGEIFNPMLMGLNSRITCGNLFWLTSGRKSIQSSKNCAQSVLSLDSDGFKFIQADQVSHQTQLNSLPLIDKVYDKVAKPSVVVLTHEHNRDHQVINLPVVKQNTVRMIYDFDGLLFSQIVTTDSGKITNIFIYDTDSKLKFVLNINSNDEFDGVHFSNGYLIGNEIKYFNSYDQIINLLY